MEREEREAGRGGGGRKEREEGSEGSGNKKEREDETEEVGLIMGEEVRRDQFLLREVVPRAACSRLELVRFSAHLVALQIQLPPSSPPLSTRTHAPRDGQKE
eukprot:660169-Rhodomonas_salina.2